jgi:hypothetical protein
LRNLFGLLDAIYLVNKAILFLYLVNNRRQFSIELSSAATCEKERCQQFDYHKEHDNSIPVVGATVVVAGTVVVGAAVVVMTVEIDKTHDD